MWERRQEFKDELVDSPIMDFLILVEITIRVLLDKGIITMEELAKKKEEITTRAGGEEKVE